MNGLTIAISIGSLLIALLSLLLNGRKESRSDAANTARLEAKMDAANAGISDIRVDVRSMQNTLQNHSDRLAKVEARARSNTHRLNRLDGRPPETADNED